jgi:hypothetical protein
LLNTDSYANITAIITSKKVGMADWQVTAVTINCPSVAEEVTIIVKSDWSVQCSGFEKYASSRRAQLALVDRSLTIKRILECKSVECNQITEYVQKLQAEENHKIEPTGDKK